MYKTIKRIVISVLSLCAGDLNPTIEEL